MLCTGSAWLTCCPALCQRGACHRWSWQCMSSTAFAFIRCPQLFDLVYREETLLNVIKSVTRNGRSIILTAVLALILVYLFSIVGYLFFKDDFILEVDKLPNETLLPGWYWRLTSPFCKTYRLSHQFDSSFFTKDAA